jgi:uracil-DNA glycosylase family 4
MVFGEGNPNAIVMFVGEGPGKEEQETGRPFVGRCGKLLRDMIRAIEIPEEHHYIANVVKDRPPGNRPPENEEIEACSKFLKKQIEIINPKVLVLLGRTAVKALMPNEANTPIGTLRTFKGHLVYSACYRNESFLCIRDSHISSQCSFKNALSQNRCQGRFFIYSEGLSRIFVIMF